MEVELLDRSTREDEKRRLESDTETYYHSLSSSEQEENNTWAKLSSAQAIQRFS